MIQPDEITSIAQAMRAAGVRRVKTSDFEMELGPPPPPAAGKFNLDEREVDEVKERKHREGLVYGSSY